MINTNLFPSICDHCGAESVNGITYSKKNALVGAEFSRSCILFMLRVFWYEPIQTVYNELARTPENAKNTPAIVVV